MLYSVISRIGISITVKRPALIPSLSTVYSKRNREKKNVLLNNSSNTFNRFKKTLYGFFRPPENKLRSNSRLKSSSSSKLSNSSKYRNSSKLRKGKRSKRLNILSRSTNNVKLKNVLSFVNFVNFVITS